MTSVPLPRMSTLMREPARPSAIRAWPHAWYLAVATVCFGAFMGQLDASVVTLTYHSVQQQFGASLAGVQWVSLAYLLTLIALLVPVGRLSDARGRKLFYLYGFVVFIAGSMACGLAPSLATLVACRAVQAIGAAMLQANSVALVATAAPAGRLRAALGVQAAAQALGLAVGPTVGGLLVNTLGWRWVFFINLPVGAVAVVAGYFLLPRTQQRCSAQHFDGTGTLLLVGFVTTVLLGLSAASGLGLSSGVIVGIIAAAAATGAALIIHQRRAAYPLIDSALLRSATISRGLGGALGGYLVLFGPLVLIPLVLARQGWSAVATGAMVTVLPAGFAFAAIGMNRWLPATWTDGRRCRLGGTVAAAALVAAAFSPPRPGYLVPLLAAVGLGLGTAIPANNSLVMAAVPAALAGTGGGLINMARGLGTALGVALVTLCLHVGGSGGGGSRLALGVLAGAASGLALSSAVAVRRSPGTHQGHRGGGCEH